MMSFLWHKVLAETTKSNLKQHTPPGLKQTKASAVLLVAI